MVACLWHMSILCLLVFVATWRWESWAVGKILDRTVSEIKDNRIFRKCKHAPNRRTASEPYELTSESLEKFLLHQGNPSLFKKTHNNSLPWISPFWVSPFRIPLILLCLRLPLCLFMYYFLCRPLLFLLVITFSVCLWFLCFHCFLSFETVCFIY